MDKTDIKYKTVIAILGGLIAILSVQFLAGAIAPNRNSNALEIKVEHSQANRKDITTATQAPKKSNSDIEDICDKVTYLDRIDYDSAYSITDAIISANGTEDTITTILEICDEQ